MINYFKLHNKSLLPSSHEDFSWLELVDPSPDEIREILNRYDVPIDYILDVDDPYEVARSEGLEDDSPNLFILIYPVKISDVKYITRPISIIVTQGIVITVRNEDSMVFLDLKEKGLRKIDECQSIENFVLELAWLIAKSYISHVRVINQKSHELEENIKSTTKTDFLYQMIELQRSLTNFQMATRENGPVIESIFRVEGIYKDDYRKDLLHDLQVENKQARIMIENSTTMLDKLTELYSNVISNNLNEVMKILTSITIVLTIPTILGGLFGMNVKLPLEDHPHAFTILLLGSFVVSIISLYILKKKDYL